MTISEELNLVDISLAIHLVKLRIICLLYKIHKGLSFRVRLTSLGSNFYYDNAFIYRVYLTVLKVPREIFGPRMVYLKNDPRGPNIFFGTLDMA